MARIKPQNQSSYGLPSGIKKANPLPIIAKRDPTTSDTGFNLGQNWINTTTGSVFAFTKCSSGAATWAFLGSISPTFTAITAGTFATSTAATAISLSSGNVFTGTGSNTNVGFTFTPKGAGGITLTTGDLTLTDGNISLGTASNGLSVKSGPNARIGQNTLTAGTVSIANTSVTANTRIFLTRASKNSGAAIGSLEAVISAGVGFTINSYAAGATIETGDISIVDWFLVESA